MASRENLSDVKARLSEFVRLAEAGETTIITANGRAVAQLGPHGGSPGEMGGGSGWLLVNHNVSARADSLPVGFASVGEGGVDAVLRDWQGGRFEAGILWLHQTEPAAVLAVPTARWDGAGWFQFYLWRGHGPVIPMRSWGDDTGWSNSAPDFHEAVRKARAIGNAALGIRQRPA